MSVEALKYDILEKEGIPPDQQRLFFAGKLLEDSRTLHEYGVHNRTGIHLLLRLTESPVPRNQLRGGAGQLGASGSSSVVLTLAPH